MNSIPVFESGIPLIGLKAKCGVRRVSISLLLLFSTAFSVSCRTTGQLPTETSSRGAILSPIPMNDDKGRIRRATLVELNGKAVSPRGQAVLRTGQNLVSVQFSTPEAGKQKVKLRFPARKSGEYYVRMIPYPQRSPLGHEGYQKSVTAERILNLAEYDFSGVYLGAALIVPALGAAFAEPVYRSVQANTYSGGNPVQYVELLVISKDPREGIVSRSRFHPS